MSNDNEEKARLWSLQTMINKMVMDDTRDATLVANHFQAIVGEPLLFGGKAKVEAIEPIEKFALLADLGYITVPDDYDHATCLAVFKEKNREKFYGYNDSISDVNFPKPTRILKPGDKLRLRAFKQVVPGTTTSKERMDFLRKQKGNVFVGAQCASHAFEQKRDQLPKGYWYASFDEKAALWEDADGHHRVPRVLAYSDGDLEFNLGDFGDVWDDGFAFFCFCDESSDA